MKKKQYNDEINDYSYSFSDHIRSSFRKSLLCISAVSFSLLGLGCENSRWGQVQSRWNIDRSYIENTCIDCGNSIEYNHLNPLEDSSCNECEGNSGSLRREDNTTLNSSNRNRSELELEDLGLDQRVLTNSGLSYGNIRKNSDLRSSEHGTEKSKREQGSARDTIILPIGYRKSRNMKDLDNKNDLKTLTGIVYDDSYDLITEMSVKDEKVYLNDNSYDIKFDKYSLNIKDNMGVLHNFMAFETSRSPDHVLGQHLKTIEKDINPGDQVTVKYLEYNGMNFLTEISR